MAPPLEDKDYSEAAMLELLGIDRKTLDYLAREGLFHRRAHRKGKSLSRR